MADTPQAEKPLDLPQAGGTYERGRDGVLRKVLDHTDTSVVAKPDAKPDAKPEVKPEAKLPATTDSEKKGA
jgi:hypothetical protein